MTFIINFHDFKNLTNDFNMKAQDLKNQTKS